MQNFHLKALFNYININIVSTGALFDRTKFVLAGLLFLAADFVLLTASDIDDSICIPLHCMLMKLYKVSILATIGFNHGFVLDVIQTFYDVIIKQYSSNCLSRAGLGRSFKCFEGLKIK